MKDISTTKTFLVRHSGHQSGLQGDRPRGWFLVAESIEGGCDWGDTVKVGDRIVGINRTSQHGEPWHLDAVVVSDTPTGTIELADGSCWHVSSGKVPAWETWEIVLLPMTDTF